MDRVAWLRERRSIEGDTAGYHYYPGRERVAEWLLTEGLTIVEEASDWEDGWGYWHLLVRTPD